MEWRADDGKGSTGASSSYLDELAELVRVLLVAGIGVGAIVGGLGSRVAMLVLRLTSPDSVRGIESDHGFTIGQVTLGGTYNLVLIGSVVGVIGAVAYVAVRPFLIGARWLRRTAVGATAAVVVGSMLVTPEGVDFTLLEPLWLAVSLFLGLAAAVAVALAVAVDRISSPQSRTARGRARWALPVAFAVPVAPALVVIAPVLLLVAVALPGARALRAPLHRSALGRGVVRAGFAAVPVVGLLALGQDLAALS
jgi:hypothetical protein